MEKSAMRHGLCMDADADRDCEGISNVDENVAGNRSYSADTMAIYALLLGNLIDHYVILLFRMVVLTFLFMFSKILENHTSLDRIHI